MVFTQIWYLHKEAVWDLNNILANYAEFTLQWRNYPIWRYSSHCKENPIYVFFFWELRGLSPNFQIHVSVSDLFIPRIGPHTVFGCSKIDRKILEIYKSLTDIWVFELRERTFKWGCTVSFLGIYEWEPDNYIGFSPALHLKWTARHSISLPAVPLPAT